MTKTEAKVLDAIDRYNRTQRQIEALEARLRTAHDVSRKRYGDMFDALPDGFAIRLDPKGGPAELSDQRSR